MLILVVPVARLACVKAQDGEGIHHVLIKGIVIAVDVVGHLQGMHVCELVYLYLHV